MWRGRGSLGGSWRRAAWCEYRAALDATWGYSQLVLDDETRTRLRCGDARWGVRVVEHALRTRPYASGRAELCHAKAWRPQAYQEGQAAQLAHDG